MNERGSIINKIAGWIQSPSIMDSMLKPVKEGIKRIVKKCRPMVITPDEDQGRKMIYRDPRIDNDKS
ncbi:MAG: hypothetical protein WA152_01385 [Microgenomates group bacterium]